MDASFQLVLGRAFAPSGIPASQGISQSVCNVLLGRGFRMVAGCLAFLYNEEICKSVVPPPHIATALNALTTDMLAKLLCVQL